MRNLTTNKTEATEVISHDVTPLTVDTDAGFYSKLGWLVLLVGLGGFLLWAMLAPLDKGVPVPGTVVKEGNRKTIQHQTGGTIEDILVKDGDVVKAGQVLVRMNSQLASSQAESSRAQYFTARLTEARLMAERDGLDKVTFPSAVVKWKDDPRLSAGFELQQQLFSSRRLALQNELGAVDENMAGVRSQMQGLEAARDSKKVQLEIVKEQLDNLRDLAKDGFVSRSRLLEMERTYSQLGGAIAEDNGNIGRAQRQVHELSMRRMQRTQEVQKEVRGMLTDVQRDVQALAARLDGQDYELKNSEIKSPVDGIVVGSNVFTHGGVVGSGMKLMEIVPSNDPFVVEGQLAINMIDRVHRGLPVELVFSAFNTNRTPHIPGILTQISADRTVDEHTGQPYYKVRATVSPEGVKLIAKHKLDIQPGMPVELFVNTGERTMMSYLLKPVFDRAKTSMTED